MGLVGGEELEETASTVISAKQSTFAAEVGNTTRNPTIKNKIILFFAIKNNEIILIEKIEMKSIYKVEYNRRSEDLVVTGLSLVVLKMFLAK